MKPDNLAATDDLRILILDLKNSEKVKQRSRFSASVAVLSQSDVCSSSLTYAPSLARVVGTVLQPRTEVIAA